MCGEHWTSNGSEGLGRGSSPHVRGAPDQRANQHGQSGIIPACAGSTRSTRQPARPERDHPRMCGEHVTIPEDALLTAGSSPHVRGAPSKPIVSSKLGGIIPACAGSTFTPSSTHEITWDHPRMCGEHSKHVSYLRFCGGSSPHVRGAQHGRLDGRVRIGIIPACAGSTLLPRFKWRASADHPRMCGEHHVVQPQAQRIRGSSPHVRGAPFLRVDV